MACGLPIITSNVHGINDYSQNGVTGYKYAPDDVFGFAEGIRNLIDASAPVEKIGAYNKEYVRKYDVSEIIQRMREVYGIGEIRVSS